MPEETRNPFDDPKQEETVCGFACQSGNLLRLHNWLVLHSWNQGRARKGNQGDCLGDINFIQRRGLGSRDQSYWEVLDSYGEGGGDQSKSMKRGMIFLGIKESSHFLQYFLLW